MIHREFDHVELVGPDKSVWSRVITWIGFVYINLLVLIEFVYFHKTNHKPKNLSFIPNDPIRLFTKLMLLLRTKRSLCWCI